MYPPGENTIRFVWYEMGVAYAALLPIIRMKTNGSRSMSAFWAALATGSKRNTTTAVLLTRIERKEVTKYTTAGEGGVRSDKIYKLRL